MIVCKDIMFINMGSALLMSIGKPCIVYVTEIQCLISEYALHIFALCIIVNQFELFVLEICEVFNAE